MRWTAACAPAALSLKRSRSWKTCAVARRSMPSRSSKIPHLTVHVCIQLLSYRGVHVKTRLPSLDFRYSCRSSLTCTQACKRCRASCDTVIDAYAGPECPLKAQPSSHEQSGSPGRAPGARPARDQEPDAKAGNQDPRSSPPSARPRPCARAKTEGALPPREADSPPIACLRHPLTSEGTGISDPPLSIMPVYVPLLFPVFELQYRGALPLKLPAQLNA